MSMVVLEWRCLQSSRGYTESSFPPLSRGPFYSSLWAPGAQLLNWIRLFATPWIAAHPVLLCLLEFAQTHALWVGDAIQPSHPLSLHLLLPSIFPSIRVFPNESALRIRRPKYWRFSFSISSSSEYSGLISFRIDWFDLLAIQVTLLSLLQHHISKALVL